MDLISKLLQKMFTIGASDLFLHPGRAPTFRVQGKLLPPEGAPLTADKIEQMARLIMLEDQHQAFMKNPDINIGISLPNIGRFRINMFRQRRDIAMVVRAIPNKLSTLESLGLPEHLKDIVMLNNGLVLIVGAAGTGKSTTLAALVEHRTANDMAHIVTLEDPVEYLFSSDRCIVSQREVGVDTLTYYQGLLNALRQSPDLLMIGEIRELNVLEKLLEFSDTGHLCLTTLHANNVVQALERMIKMFPEDRREQALISLAQNLRVVIAQRLVPSVSGKLTLAYEMHTFSAHTADLVRRNEISKIYDVMCKDASDMNHTFDQSLYKLFRAGKVSEATAVKYAASGANMRLQLRLGAAAANQPKTS